MYFVVGPSASGGKESSSGESHRTVGVRGGSSGEAAMLTGSRAVMAVADDATGSWCFVGG